MHFGSVPFSEVLVSETDEEHRKMQDKPHSPAEAEEQERSEDSVGIANIATSTQPVVGHIGWEVGRKHR